MMPPILVRFLSSEATGGIILVVAAIVALILANSPLAMTYQDLLHAEAFGVSLLHVVNDGLMALFFLLVGLEIKRELIAGELSSWQQRILPGVAAIGGMLVPAVIYALVNLGSPDTSQGWAIPSATDIAFSLAILSLAGKRVPASLKVFLTALAIIDDLGAILIIALFYSADLQALMLLAALAAFLLLVAFNLLGVRHLMAYLLAGAALWFFVLKAGVHPTIAGVLLALTIPLGRRTESSPLLRLEHKLQAWVAYAVLPLFAFANAGVPVGGLSFGTLLQPVSLGSALGLFVGKQVGIFGGILLAARSSVVKLPSGASLIQVYGVAVLCGIGFTMSLFIGMLAFPTDHALQDQTKIGVLLGSCLSAIAGWAILRLSWRKDL
jgi:NhaA family Na+:H+ antiporter